MKYFGLRFSEVINSSLGLVQTKTIGSQVFSLRHVLNIEKLPLLSGRICKTLSGTNSHCTLLLAALILYLDVIICPRYYGKKGKSFALNE